VRGEGDSNAVAVIPAQHRLTHQILNHWLPFEDLKQAFAVSRRALVELPISACGCKKITIDALIIMIAPVLSIPEPKRLMIGQSSN
jgi:hypothetical protein